MKKTLPNLTTDDEAAAFVETAELSQYVLSGMVPNTFEFAPKGKQVKMRLSEQLLTAVKSDAAARGVSYHRFIRQTLERAVHPAS